MALFSTVEFEHQFKELYRPLCLFALRYTGQIDDAEDVVQQAFTDVWGKLSGGQAIENLKAYMYQTVRNRSLSFITSMNEQRSLEEIPDLTDYSGDEEVFLAERNARLWNAIDQLPPERKKIFLLSKRDGLKYQEIADELTISIKTVENQMGKALKTLRESAKRIYLFFFG
ncbi:RNA polymerase sigma-70 factor [Parabacteroides sp. PF5-9]|uniref:RNA polymerase sigma-70 factor n=1 Tax=Parabacteroides sp. PF5-9 TaxID=1742404 RepID=UPI00247599FB|nr:RNA polymerase sigma-70 factor [Parabacteroides sp. PF5-9]MDH6359049.1 RNA polymerase sigma-70 factor (family 1) [Parabacteroides sp. PF5-9]